MKNGVSGLVRKKSAVFAAVSHCLMAFSLPQIASPDRISLPVVVWYSTAVASTDVSQKCGTVNRIIESACLSVHAASLALLVLYSILYVPLRNWPSTYARVHVCLKTR